MSNFIKHNGSTREAFEIHRKKHIADLGDVALR
jgi:hypothetical protein